MKWSSVLVIKCIDISSYNKTNKSIKKKETSEEKEEARQSFFPGN